jgi:ribosomal protein S18 acetylase RimI-like enzyme
VTSPLRARNATIREAVSGDATRVVDLAIASASVTDRAVAQYFVHRAFATDGRDARCLVAERDDTVIGCIVYGEVAGTIGTGRLLYVAVDPPARRQGVGRSLCAAALTALESAGMGRVIVELADDGQGPACQFFESNGFTPAGRVADYYRDRLDLLILSARTSSP